MLHSYFQISPEMFDRVLAGPLKDIQRLVLKLLLRCLCCMLRIVVLLEGEPSLQSDVLSTLEQVFIKDLSVSSRRDTWNSGQRVELCLIRPEVPFCKSVPEQQQRTCEDAGGNRYKSIYTHSKTSPISTYPERPLSKEAATAPKPL